MIPPHGSGYPQGASAPSPQPSALNPSPWSPQTSRWKRRTKIVCTLGPASSSPEVIERLIVAGMDVARLNFSHGTREQHRQTTQILRDVSQRLGVPIAILQDLPGPKIRLGPIEHGHVRLHDGDRFVLTTHQVPGSATEVSVPLPNLPRDLVPGNIVLLDDGKIELEVTETTDAEVVTKVVVGGLLYAHKGLNVPKVTLDVPGLTDRDFQFLHFGAELGVDYVALSFVRTGADLQRAREVLHSVGSTAPLIAKIEKHEALNALEEVLAAADGLMVARGDLGLETPLEEVPLVQKRLIRACNHAGKPVITATQMLESMISNVRPTRAEVADAVNAILDGTDALMLSAETAIGEYPVEACRMLARVARSTEREFPRGCILEPNEHQMVAETPDAISFA
ncbi:MAG: pyruvate kinase, partial [Chloroflexi bacterium]|nr:pyruvate kinase [Chloroflexota bacterium]